MKRILCIRLAKGPSRPWLERCGRFSPIVGLEATDEQSLLLDITGVARLFGGEAAMVRIIGADFARQRQPVRLAIADTLGAAWAVATSNSPLPQAGEGQGVRAAPNSLSQGAAGLSSGANDTFGQACFIVPVGKTLAALADLPIALLRLPEEPVRLLRELGIFSIEQLELLPREELSSRFGPELLLRLDQALGRLDEPVPALPVLPKFEADWQAEHPTANRETLEAVLEHLVGRVAAMLAASGRGALRLECRLALESGRIPLSIGLFRPTVAAGHLFELVRLPLERLRLASPVTGVSVTADPTVPLEPRRQAQLFETQPDSNPRDEDSLGALVERLCSRLGENAVSSVRLRPEAQPELSWHYDPLLKGPRRRRAQKTLSAELAPRPLRLLPRPAALVCVACDAERDVPLRDTSDVGVGHAHPTICGQAAACDRTSEAMPAPPRKFFFAGQEHHIAQSWGPERIETGWWRGRSVGRDYFRVETATGRRFWIFRRLRDEKWFLHGLFE